MPMLSSQIILYNSLQILILIVLDVYTILEYSNELSSFEYMHYIINAVWYSCVMGFHINCAIRGISRTFNMFGMLLYVSIPFTMVITVVDVTISSYTLNKLFDSFDYLPALESFISLLSITVLLSFILIMRAWKKDGGMGD